jgi:arsenite-transporting ATPase
MRIILYTGKGGVGKTSIAAATACKIAQEGLKVLIISTDQAHSLSDSFDMKLSNEPVKIKDNLFGLEVDAVHENEIAWGNIKKYIAKLMFTKSQKSIESEELLVFPGFEDLLSLIKIKEINDSGEYDVLIVDCAPTGETMSLLKFPELLKWWMEKIFPMKRKAARIAKPIIENTVKIPLPDNATFDEMENLYKKVDELHELLLDKEKVSIRIVTTPEKIVIKEAKRSFSYMHLFDFNVDAVIVNKIFSEKSSVGYFEKWVEIQNKSMTDVIESFNPVPVFKSELMDSEVRGYELLLGMGKTIFGREMPEKVFFKDRIFEIKKIDDKSSKFIVNLPFVDKKELNIYQNGDELSISIKNEKRNFILPINLQSRDISKASYVDNHLEIYFN